MVKPVAHAVGGWGGHQPANFLAVSVFFQMWSENASAVGKKAVACKCIVYFWKWTPPPPASHNLVKRVYGGGGSFPKMNPHRPRAQGRGRHKWDSSPLQDTCIHTQAGIWNMSHTSNTESVNPASCLSASPDPQTQYLIKILSLQNKILAVTQAAIVQRFLLKGRPHCFL